MSKISELMTAKGLMETIWDTAKELEVTTSNPVVKAQMSYIIGEINQAIEIIEKVERGK